MFCISLFSPLDKQRNLSLEMRFRHFYLDKLIFALHPQMQYSQVIDFVDQIIDKDCGEMYNQYVVL